MKNPLTAFIKYYFHDMKLKWKFMISHMILVLVPTLVLSFLFFQEIYDIIVTNTIRSEQALSDQTANTVEATLSQINNTSASIMNNSFVTNLLQNSRLGAVVEEPDERIIRSFADSVSSMVDGKLITDIRIYLDEPYQNLCVHTGNNGLFLPMSKIDGSYWHGIFAGNSYTSLWCPSLYLSPSEKEQKGTLALVKRLSYLNAPEKASAFIVVYFSKDQIDSILGQDITITNNSKYINNVTYLTNEKDVLISASSYPLAGAHFISFDTLLKSVGSPNNYITRTFEGENIYVGYYALGDTGWYMVSVIPDKNLIQKSNQFIYGFIALYLVILIAALIISLLLSNSIVKRISSVITQMRTVKTGKPSRLEDVRGKDEIGDLIDTYNYMTDEMNHLLEKQAEAAKELRMSEFKALQAQINPHFLYNTLDMINWQSKSGRREEVTQAVQALSKFYKLTLSRRGTLGTIEQELEHVSLYVQLQNMRYNHCIDFVVDVPDELMDYEIPKLTFQPIVENSIGHGILEKEEKQGTVVLTGWLEDSIVVFSISDDGVGIEPERLAGILSGRGTSTSGSNIGVVNTHNRLKLFYGNEYGLTYSSVVGEGTEVLIRIPAIHYRQK